MQHDVEDTIYYTAKDGTSHAFYIQGSDVPNEDGYTYAFLRHVTLTRNGYDDKVLGWDHFTLGPGYGTTSLSLAYDDVHTIIECDRVPIEERWAQYAAEEAAERYGW